LWRKNPDESWSLYDQNQKSCKQCDNSDDFLFVVKEEAGDEKLLAYLYKRKHMTPFEMAGAIFEIKAPIMVFREWHRHRTQSYNEMSARYIPLPNENYVPDRKDVMERSQAAYDSKNKQARSASDRVVTEGETLQWLHDLDSYYERGQRLYEEALQLGIPKELARLPVTVGRFSVMRASANLRNWLQFLELRTALQAQKEIRLYAESVCSVLELDFPRTMALFGRSHGS
jgi:thymidylate synthase (FAD)